MGGLLLMDNQKEAIRDARKLGIPKMLLLGFQHMFAMFGATILVPLLVNGYFEGQGLSIQVTLVCAGLGTLFFHLCTKLKVPAFLGSSFAFLGGFSTVANLKTGIFKDMTMGEKLPYACGGIVVAGLLYLILALIVKLVGVKRVMRFLPPVVTGPIIICIGLSLAPSAISNASSNMLFAPLPMMVFDADTQAVVWCNDGFLELTEQKEGVFDAHLNAVVPSFSVRWLLEGKNECPENVVWNHRIYRVYGGLTRPPPDTPSTMATTYWMDVTDSEQLRQTLQMTRPVVAILMVDNYEDLMKACPESKRSAVLAQLEEKLDQWSAGADGLMLHYDRDRYLFVFEERSYSDYAQHRFAVLDTVREVAAGHSVHRRGPGCRQLRRPVQKCVYGPGDGPEPRRRPGGGKGPAELPVLRRPGQDHGKTHQGEIPGHGQRPG